MAVGRLDEDTTGLLLFTTDGNLATKLVSPQFKVPKVYQAKLRTPTLLTEKEILRLKYSLNLPCKGTPLVSG